MVLSGLPAKGQLTPRLEVFMQRSEAVIVDLQGL